MVVQRVYRIVQCLPDFAAGRAVFIPKIGAVARSFNGLEISNKAYAISIPELLLEAFQCCKGSIAIIHGNMLQ